MTILQFVSQDIVLAIAIIFGVIGFTQGARREMTVTLFILLGIALTSWFDEQVVVWVNRIYRLIRIALSGALTSDNPGAALARVPATPLIEGADSRFILRLVVFGVVLWLGYWLSRRGKKVLTPLGLATLRRPPVLLARLAGAIAGAINGFLITYYLIPRLSPGVQTVLVIPTFATSLLQQRWLPLVVLVVVALFIFVGWERARG